MEGQLVKSLAFFNLTNNSNHQLKVSPDATPAFSDSSTLASLQMCLCECKEKNFSSK